MAGAEYQVEWSEMVYHLTRRPNRGRVSRCRMRSTGATAVHGAPRVVPRSYVSRCRGRRTKRKLGFVTGGWHGLRPAIGVVLVVCKIDAAVVPGVAVATSRLETGERSLRRVTGGVLKQGSRRVSVLTSIENGSERRHAAWLTEAVEHAGRTSRIFVAKVGAGWRVSALDRWLSSLE